MKVLVTGSKGFIGKNLIVHLKELNIKTLTYTRENSTEDLKELINDADCIVHLAGVNRPKDEKDFEIINAGLTLSICNIVRQLDKNIPIILASSSQVELDNKYGKSKLKAEKALKELEIDTNCSVYIYRLPGVFGKWSRPDYNSVVATFCYNISHGLPIQINNPSHELTLVYIDDVVKEFVSIIQYKKVGSINFSIQPEYKIKLSELAKQLQCFHKSRHTLISERVGTGFIRKLYSTYVSYIPPKKFSYSIPAYIDERGRFAEILKTKDSGQISFFTAKPGITRGGHYHHSKTEKFLVVKGKARFRFRHVIINKTYELLTTDKDLKIVETVPGWSHDITNVGNEEMIVMLWANEIFDHDNNDTIVQRL